VGRLADLIVSGAGAEIDGVFWEVVEIRGDILGKVLKNL
jgi:hypothetical protein